MTKYYVDIQGNYIGGFDGSYPKNGIEVPFAPNNALDNWNGSEWIPYVPIPQKVTMAQARLALYEDGSLELVDEIINSMPIKEQRDKARIQWEFETIVNRDSALVYGLAGGLGKTDEMLDELFIKASKIK